MAETTKRYAVVTGGNKGIGFEICRQLASAGIVVILTARDAKRGTEAVQKLKDQSGFSNDQVMFYQLDVSDPATINSLPEFIRTRFGKLDILVNNAGILGIKDDVEALRAIGADMEEIPADVAEKFHNQKVVSTQKYELPEESLNTNYYGAKRMIDAHLPLLLLSDSPRIVNVSAAMGKLENVTNEWAKGVLSDIDILTEERIDEVLSRYMKDFKEGSLEANGWPTFLSAYIISKAAMNAGTRLVAKKHPNFRVNCVCPGIVKTDLTFNKGFVSAEEGAAFPVKLALLPNDGPTGCFFVQDEERPF